MVECNGEPRALLAARLERIRFSPRIGYFAPLKIPASVLTMIYQGALGDVDQEIAQVLVRHMRSLLAAGEADVAEFHHLPENSALLEVLCAKNTEWWCDTDATSSWNTHWRMALTDGQELLSKRLRSKHRAWIRRKQRDLESAFPGRVSWRWISRCDDIPRLCTLLEGVAVRTYQRGLGAGFVDNEEHRQRFGMFGQRRQLRVQLLEIDGSARAFWIGTVHKNTFHSSETGYVPDFRVYEPGTLVLIRMLDELVREDVETLDFGLGDASYKQRFGDQFWRERTVRLFASTAKGLAIKASRGFFAALDGAGRHLAGKFGGLDRLKARWRRRLADSGPEAEKE